MMQPQCETCHYWIGKAPRLVIGQCRATPPTPLKVDGIGIWPNTYPDSWCGAMASTHRQGQDMLDIIRGTPETVVVRPRVNRRVLVSTVHKQLFRGRLIAYLETLVDHHARAAGG